MANPPPISEDDINKGMITLLNRGIIPKDVDLTPAFEKGAPPVQFKGAVFHEKREKNIRGEVFTEKFNKNSIKFDLQSSVPRNIKLEPINQSQALVPVSKSLVKSGLSMKSTTQEKNMQLALPAPHKNN